ncbi:MAG: DUF6268 family outer membrane beta-barrel protein [Verrucomicrobiota bacterium]|nr:DUF6268 family outer membrane beta-barrel protein [Verrucomicrobiota bacterium]
MKNIFFAFALCVTAGLTFHVAAGDNQLIPIQTEESVAETRKALAAQVDYSYVAPANLSVGSNRLGDIDEHFTSINTSAIIPISDKLYFRFGPEWSRFSFGMPSAAPMPNTLQEVAMLIGADYVINDAWQLRMEMHPGLYSDFQDISFDDVNIPATFGASYSMNESLKFLVGISVNPRREYPVLPGAGVWWKINDKWTLNAVMPKPRIEYHVNDTVTLHAGGEVKGGTYMVADDFGRTHGIANLDSEPIDYWEVRTGAGLTWNVREHVSVGLEGGYMIDRNIEYNNANTRLDTEGAPYGAISVKAKF